MSNALAIAAVTAVLKDLLDNALIDRSASAAVGGGVAVTALPPDRIATGDDEVPQLNLFLYHVAPNAALRNADLPSRNGRGERQSNPPLALDLFYLLSAYGAQDFQAEILLGYAMQLLHETPVLGREAIRRSLAAPSPVGGGILPPALSALAAADLAEQPETIRITPHPLGSEELSRLWTATQANFRPSATYQASVVLIRSELPARDPLPVLTRGPVDPDTGKERGVRVIASLVPPIPALVSAVPPAEQPAVRMGEVLALVGRFLEGDEVVVRFTHVGTGRAAELPAQPGGTATRVEVRLPADPPPAGVGVGSPLHPRNWRAGVYAVEAVVRRAGQADRATNPLAVVLAPRLAAVSAAAVADGIRLTAEVRPPVHRTQRVRLLVGTRELPADEPAGESTSTPTFTAAALPSGEQWVRIRVDDAESLLVDRAAEPPVFDPSQRVTIP